MIRIKVQYDQLTRSFKLVDDQFKTLLEGDALYDLDLPLFIEGDSIEEPWSSPYVAHA
jgi:hypothetical protein